MIPAAIHTPTIGKLGEPLSDCVSLKAMTLPTMVSVALTRGIVRRVFLPTTAEKCPSLENHPICAPTPVTCLSNHPAPVHATTTAYAQGVGIASLNRSILHQDLLTKLSSQVLRAFGTLLPGRQAMYACTHETESGFFARVCALSDQACISSDPPPLCNSWIASCLYCLRLRRFVPLIAVKLL
jgi:hypothetical protein